MTKGLHVARGAGSHVHRRASDGKRDDAIAVELRRRSVDKAEESRTRGESQGREGGPGRTNFPGTNRGRRRRRLSFDTDASGRQYYLRNVNTSYERKGGVSTEGGLD